MTVKFYCKIDESHPAMTDLNEAILHIIRECREKKLRFEAPASDYLERNEE